jgi:anthranilate/para-aminobenzoate synthase component II
MTKKIQLLMVDNYDSFTYNIVQYFGELGADVTVVRNDEITVDEIQRRLDAGQIDRLVISPGPCSPAEAASRARRSSISPASCRSWVCVSVTRASARRLAARSSVRRS